MAGDFCGRSGLPQLGGVLVLVFFDFTILERTLKDYFSFLFLLISGYEFGLYMYGFGKECSPFGQCFGTKV